MNGSVANGSTVAIGKPTLDTRAMHDCGTTSPRAERGGAPDRCGRYRIGAVGRPRIAMERL
ncbi:hypothetical protein WS69_23370 [Burkholderia sp. BDU5]|nr:hypothetical protein WS69_23370 [Burkholderia sp. BDU5]